MSAWLSIVAAFLTVLKALTEYLRLSRAERLSRLNLKIRSKSKNYDRLLKALKARRKAKVDYAKASADPDDRSDIGELPK